MQAKHANSERPDAQTQRNYTLLKIYTQINPTGRKDQTKNENKISCQFFFCLLNLEAKFPWWCFAGVNAQLTLSKCIINCLSSPAVTMHV